MIFLAAPVASEDQRPWDSIGSEAFPDAVRPPAWLNPYLKTSAQGKHNDLPALLQSVHKDQWVTGNAAAETRGMGQTLLLIAAWAGKK